MRTLSYAPNAWKGLNGIFCVYKPAGLSARNVRVTLCFNLCRDLNELEQRESSKIVSLKGSVCAKKPFEVQFLPNFAEHEFVSGPHYQPQDLKMKWISPLGRHASGIDLMAVNNGCIQLLRNPSYHSYLRKYEIKGKFGMATDNFMSHGKVIEKSSYKHVKQRLVDRVLASIQASQQRLMFEGISLQSQKAYELASSGLVRPNDSTRPIIYSIKCTDFNLPFFTLDVHCINETESFLTELIHDIGIDVKSNAMCMQLRRVQYGHFSLPHALLRKHWTLEHILNNLVLSQALLDEQPDSSNFHYIRETKQKDIIKAMQDKVREEHI